MLQTTGITNSRCFFDCSSYSSTTRYVCGGQSGGRRSHDRTERLAWFRLTEVHTSFTVLEGNPVAFTASLNFNSVLRAIRFEKNLNGVE